MKINKILEAFQGKKEFIDKQAKLVYQLQDYIGTNIRPDLTSFSGINNTKQDIIFQLEQKISNYERAFEQYQQQDKKARELINVISGNFKGYKQELATEVKEAVKFVKAIKDLLEEVEQ